MKPALVLLGLLIGLVVAGCGEIKGEAVEAAIEIRGFCKEKKNDQANAKGVEMYEANEVFRVAVDESAAVWKTKDIANYNYCGPAFVDGHRKMTEAKEPDSCSCRVVGFAGGRGQARWLLLAGLAAALVRRRRSRR